MAGTHVRVGKRQYELGSTLGVGGFSEVKKGIDMGTNKRVALKITYTDQISNQRDMNNQLRSVQKEIKSMKKLNHINIVRLLGYDLKCVVENRNAIVMVQELAPKGELFDYLMHTNKFEQTMAISVFHQLIAGLSAIHGAGIAHRDLKPENLLFDKDFNLKIADFGFSFTYQKGENPRTLMRTELGTKGYMAPEILSHTKYTEKADIFAAGVILFIMLAGFPPFQDAQASDWWFDKLTKKKYRLFWMAHERTASFTSEAKLILQTMLAADPDDRPDCEGIQSSSFYTASHLDKHELKRQLAERQVRVDNEKHAQRQTQSKTRDTFQEGVLKVKNKFAGQTLDILKLVTSECRNALGEVEDEGTLKEALEKFSSATNKLTRLRELQTDDIDISRVPTLRLATSPEQILEVFPNVNMKEAELMLEQLDTSDAMGHIEDYDPELYEQLTELDYVELPDFSSLFYTPNTYKTAASLGLVAYSVGKYLEKRGLQEEVDLGVDVDKRVPTLTLSAVFPKIHHLPVEQEDGEIVFQEFEQEVPFRMDICIYQDKTTGENILTLTNGNITTVEQFKEMERDLTSNQELSLLASCLSPFAAEDSAFFDVSTYEEHGLEETEFPELGDEATN